MADTLRARKMEDRIHQIVARLLESRIKDPRLGFVTVTAVRVTGDLQRATVFYTVFGGDEERESSAAALRSATGMIRSEVGKQLGVRLTRHAQNVVCCHVCSLMAARMASRMFSLAVRYLPPTLKCTG